MQIIYVLGVLMLALYSIVEVESSSSGRNAVRAITKRQIVDHNLQKQIKQAARKAYDFGLEDSGCPANTTEMVLAGSNFPTCWGSEVSDGCFVGITHLDQAVCFALNQNVVAGNETNTSTLAYLLQIPKAFAALRQPAVWGTINTGLYNKNPVPQGNGGGSGATVRLPAANPGNEFATNHINCTAAHTECFTIIYCLNGSQICTGADRLVNTYAIRRY